MADPIPGTTPVTDQRPQPRGVIPRHAQAWLMAGLAAGIIGIIAFTGQSNQPMGETPAPGGTQPTVDAERLGAFAQQVRQQLDAQTRQHESSESTPMTSPYSQPSAPPSPDPLEAEKKRRNYESLFAGILVPGRARTESAARPTGRASLDDPAYADIPPVPDLDAIAQAIVRASGRGQSGTAGSPMPPPAPEPGASADRGALAPDAREPEASRSGATTRATQHRLLEGTLIPSVLTNRLDGSTVAPVNCLVTAPVYTQDGQQVLIPAGARVLGMTKPVQAHGEARLAVTFHRLLMPNGTTYALDQFMGLSQGGDAGLRDRVDHHYVSTFGAAAAVGLLTGLSQALGTAGIGQGDGDRVIVLSGGLNDTTQATVRTLDRLLNRLPTITIDEGYRVHVYLTRDLVLPAYETTAAPGLLEYAATGKGES